MAVRIQFRRDTEINWSNNNPTLAEGEMGLEKDTGRWKIGNGLDNWTSLPYSNSIFAGPSVITDSSTGNALRITQSGTGNALVVEDSTNPDSTPFVINNIGNVGIGTASPATLLEVNGQGSFSGILSAPTASVDTNTTQVATTAFVIGQEYLKASSASATYLSQVSASTTYLSQSSASTTYLSQIDASSTYLSQSSASITYLSQVSASSIYAPIASPTFTGTVTLAASPTLALHAATKLYVDSVQIDQKTTDYALLISDAGKLIEMNSASANTVTVPLDSSANFPVGTSIDIYQYGTGQTQVIGESGVTVRSKDNKLNLTGQYSAATIVKRGADDWVIFGDLS